jgi:Tol biopolymer transport system component
MTWRSLAVAVVCLLQSCGGGGGDGGSGGNSGGGGNGTTGTAGARRIDRAEFIVANAAGTVVGYAGATLDTTGLPPNTGAFLNALLYSVPSGARTLVSVDPSQTSAGNAVTGALRISADGQTVVFTSRATNLVPGITYPGAPGNPLQQIYARNLAIGVTQLVSMDTTSTSGANVDDVSDRFAVSANGRYVAFSSRANNLVLGVAYAGQNNVFVRDLMTGVTELVSISPDGLSAGCCGGVNESLFPAISEDGRYVAFASDATNLVAGVTYTPDVAGIKNIFLRDRTMASTLLLSVSEDGLQASNGGCNVQVATTAAYMTADASAVAFTCRATNLISGPIYPANPSDVYLWRRATGTLTLVSRSFDATEAADNGAFEAVVSADGRYVAFQSPAFNLVDNVTYFIKGPGGPGVSNIFRWDRLGGATQLVSQSLDGTSGADFDTQFPVISADGGVVAFNSSATNISSPPVALTFDDRQSNAAFWTAASGAIALASVNASNQPLGRINPVLAMSENGNLVVFLSNLDRSAYIFPRP